MSKGCLWWFKFEIYAAIAHSQPSEHPCFTAWGCGVHSPGGNIIHFFEPLTTAFQALVQLGSTWKLLPERAGPTISHLDQKVEQLTSEGIPQCQVGTSQAHTEAAV
eukprot:1158127-Pelagomonas_calceolata.AAC.7